MPLDFADEKSTLVPVITWANVDPDLCRHMVPLGHNELKKNKTVHTSVDVL